MRRLTLVIPILSLFSTTNTFASSSTAELLRISDAYGASHWDEVEAIKFTFNVERKGKTVQRIWEWEPGTGKVTCETTDNGQPFADAYNHKDPNEAAEHKKTDAWFINDEYWLLFPLHLSWDEFKDVTFATGEQPLPIGKGKAAKLTVAYGPEGGYTPGDMYELYYGPVIQKDFVQPPKPDPENWEQSRDIIRQWSYHKGGAAQPTMSSTWEGYQRLGPVIIATEHRDGTGSFHLWFSDLAMKLKGDARWIRPETARRLAR